jgi:hypothetical protein
VVESIAMTLVRAPGPPLPRFDHRVAAEPRPPRRPTGASGRHRRSTAGDTSHPGGRSPSRAPQRTPSAASNRGRSPSKTLPEGKAPRRSGRYPSSPTGLASHACSAGANFEAVTFAREGVQAALEARCRREATGEAFPTQPAGGRRYRSRPTPEGEAHLLGRSPDPGPRQLRSQRR